MPGSLCLVTTVREPGAAFESFLRYHLAFGVNHVIVFFDDPQDPAIAIARRYGDAVTLVPADDALWARYPKLQSYAGQAALVKRSHSARQVLNAEIGIQIALAQGHQWLLHLDADELIFTPEGSIHHHLANVEADGIDMAHYVNYEAVPTGLTVADCFRDVHLFKPNPALFPGMQQKAVRDYYEKVHTYYFTGHDRGKSLVRLRPGLLPDTRHSFRLVAGHERFAAYIRPVILHYAHCGLDAYVAKIARLAETPDVETMALPFYQESVAAWRQGGAEALEKLYRHAIMVLPSDKLLQHLGDQTIGKLYGPARILGAYEQRLGSSVPPTAADELDLSAPAAAAIPTPVPPAAKPRTSPPRATGPLRK